MIEQHAHWQQAAAVRAGLQSASDPEREDVESIAAGIRLYAARDVDGESVRPCKRLQDGMWVNGIANRADADIADV
jgi:hypothetical protein